MKGHVSILSGSYYSVYRPETPFFTPSKCASRLFARKRRLWVGSQWAESLSVLELLPSVLVQSQSDPEVVSILLVKALLSLSGVSNETKFG